MAKRRADAPASVTTVAVLALAMLEYMGVGHPRETWPAATWRARKTKR